MSEEIKEIAETEEVEDVKKENKIVKFVKDHKDKFVIGGIVAGAVALFGGIVTAIAKGSGADYYDYEDDIYEHEYTTVDENGPIEVDAVVEVETESEK